MDIHRGKNKRRRKHFWGPLNRWRGHRYLEQTKSEKITESAPMKVDGATPWCCGIYLCQIPHKCCMDKHVESVEISLPGTCSLVMFILIAKAGAAPSITQVVLVAQLRHLLCIRSGGTCAWFLWEGAHMNTPVTCELRHLSGCNMGRFPVCFWSCAIYGSGTHNQTAHTPVAKFPQIQPYSPNTKYVFAVLRGKKMAQVRTLY